MTSRDSNYVILFKAVSYALKAEKILKQEDLPYKLIPVPKQISSDCGVCLLVRPDVKEKIETALLNKVEIEEIRALDN